MFATIAIVIACLAGTLLVLKWHKKRETAAALLSGHHPHAKTAPLIAWQERLAAHYIARTNHRHHVCTSRAARLCGSIISSDDCEPIDKQRVSADANPQKPGGDPMETDTRAQESS